MLSISKALLLSSKLCCCLNFFQFFVFHLALWYLLFSELVSVLRRFKLWFWSCCCCFVFSVSQTVFDETECESNQQIWCSQSPLLMTGTEFVAPIFKWASKCRPPLWHNVKNKLEITKYKEVGKMFSQRSLLTSLRIVSCCGMRLHLLSVLCT